MGSLNIVLGNSTEEQSRGYTYRDFDIKFVKGNKDYNTLDDLEAVQRGLANIFTWEKGQRILLPEFGNNIRSFLYEPINEETITNLGESLRGTIETWEPRVKIDELNVSTDPDDDHTLIVQMLFSIPTLSEQQFIFNDAIRGDLGEI
jgi:phage baseplate assembly protein W